MTAFLDAVIADRHDEEAGWPALETELNKAFPGNPGPALALAGLFSLSDEKTLQGFLEGGDRLRDHMLTRLEVWGPEASPRLRPSRGDELGERKHLQEA